MWARSWYLHSIVLAFLLASEAFSQQGIPWQTDLQNARQQAGVSNRLVLIHFWAPWCPSCRTMDQKVFVDPAVMGTVERNFVPVKLNVDHYPAEARQLGVTALPTTVVITPEGQIVESHTGMTGASEYAARLLQVATTPRRQVAVAGQPGPTMPPTSARDAAPVGPMQPSPVTGPQFAAGPAASSGQPWGTTPPVDVAAGGMPGGDSRNVPPQSAGLPGQPQGYAASGVPPQYASPSPPPVPSWDMASAQGPAGYQPPPVANVGGPSPGAPSPGVPSPGVQVAGASPPIPVVDPIVEESPLRSAVPSGMNPPTGQPNVPPSANVASLALDGYCPVELVESKAWKVGDRRWGATHQGRTYLFTGPEQQRRFLDAPDRYSPVNSGNDVVLAMDEGQAVPGRRDHGVFYGNRIYLFASEDSLEAFSRQPARYETALQRAAQAARMGNYR